ncbi:Tim44/TimA family putative adaptor protein [Croceibacterium sp. TMG7-5b_MA50]|uniref:Tim44/TimA family putative adaptor protein n=1 Tax=Croceibacterium sp. TMG7-5b_MA50 TaxID=3121290 RepID=UPI0032221540
MIEIVILAMIAAFLGLRLYSVLGRRAEHEEEPVVPTRFDRADGAAPRPLSAPQTDRVRPQAEAARPIAGVPAAAETALRQIAMADRRFDPAQFVGGARGAYRMILEAFWRGDREELRSLCDDDVYASFASAIDAREAAGETLDNRLVRIEDVRIEGASLTGRTARIAVLFVADIAAVTRDRNGNVIAGSLVDAIEARDVWTFSRDLDSADPDWLLDETDEG